MIALVVVPVSATSSLAAGEVVPIPTIANEKHDFYSKIGADPEKIISVKSTSGNLCRDE